MIAGNIISFIIPVLNGEETIGMCLEAIIEEQDYPKDRIEIILVDNGSKDKTIDIAKRYTANILTDTFATVAKLRNKGASAAKGEFLAFIDSDCIIPKDWLKAALPYFDKDDVGMVGSKVYNLPEGAPWWKTAWKIHLDRNKDAGDVSWFSSEAIIVRKDIFLSMGGFDETLVTCEDVDFGYRLGKRYRIVSDEKLSPLHLEKVQTLADFFKKEVWRSRGNIAVALKHLDKPKEVLSIAFVLYYLILLALLFPALAVSFITKNIFYFVIILFGLAIPLIAVSFDTCKKTGKYSYFFQLLIVYSVYVLAKVRAIFK